MPTRRSETWSWMNALPFVAMLTITCLDMTGLTIVKAAMNGGMGSIIYVAYHTALGTLILFSFFIVRLFRNVGRPPLTLYLVFRFFILGLLGLCLFQILGYTGVYYSSPTMASATSNLTPVYAYWIAVIFRMEKIEIRSSSSVAKLLGTVIAISGAMVFTFCQGPEILRTIPSPDSSNQVLLAQSSNWIFGGLLLVISGIFYALWYVLQSATVREYPDQQTIVFFYCLFGTMQSIAVSPFLEPNLSAWVLQPRIGMIAVVFGIDYLYLKAVYSVVIRTTVITWCLKKKGPVFVAMFSPLMIVIAFIMDVTFLGDSLHLGSTIGATIIATGFYTVIWGQYKEKNIVRVVMEDNSDIVDESGLYKQTTPLLSSRNESRF